MTTTRSARIAAFEQSAAEDPVKAVDVLRAAPPPLLARMVDGLLGRKTGRGFYTD